MKKVKLVKWIPVLGGLIVILASRLPWWRRCYDRQKFAWYEWQLLSAGILLAMGVMAFLSWLHLER